MHCPETSQVLLVLLIAIDIIIVGTLVPTVILSEQTMRNTSVIILSLTLLLTVSQVLRKKKIEKYLMLTFHSARILSTFVFLWAATTTFMDHFAKSLIVFSTLSLLFDALKHLHQPSTDRPQT